MRYKDDDDGGDGDMGTSVGMWSYRDVDLGQKNTPINVGFLEKSQMSGHLEIENKIYNISKN